MSFLTFFEGNLVI